MWYKTKAFLQLVPKGGQNFRDLMRVFRKGGVSNFYFDIYDSEGYSGIKRLAQEAGVSYVYIFQANLNEFIPDLEFVLPKAKEDILFSFSRQGVWREWAETDIDDEDGEWVEEKEFFNWDKVETKSILYNCIACGPIGKNKKIRMLDRNSDEEYMASYDPSGVITKYISKGKKNEEYEMSLKDLVADFKKLEKIEEEKVRAHIMVFNPSEEFALQLKDKFQGAFSVQGKMLMKYIPILEEYNLKNVFINLRGGKKFRYIESEDGYCFIEALVYNLDWCDVRFPLALYVMGSAIFKEVEVLFYDNDLLPLLKKRTTKWGFKIKDGMEDPVL